MPDFPKIGGASASEVWSHGTRELTGDSTNAVRDAVISDATKIPGANIDAAISSRATQAQILSDATPFAGANVDAAISSRADGAEYTAARAGKLDKIQQFEQDQTGTLTADGTEQTVREILTTVSKLHAYIDLTDMQAGDTIVVRQYMKIASTGSFVKYAEETYSGAQSIPLLHIVMKPTNYGIRITLEQTAGTYRDYDWQTFQEKAAA